MDAPIAPRRRSLRTTLVVAAAAVMLAGGGWWLFFGADPEMVTLEGHIRPEKPADYLLILRQKVAPIRFARATATPRTVGGAGTVPLR